MNDFQCIFSRVPASVTALLDICKPHILTCKPQILPPYLRYIPLMLIKLKHLIYHQLTKLFLSLCFNTPVGQAWCLTPIIPALWVADAGGSQGQKIKTILANMVKPHLY